MTAIISAQYIVCRPGKVLCTLACIAQPPQVSLPLFSELLDAAMAGFGLVMQARAQHCGDAARRGDRGAAPDWEPLACR